MDLRITPTNVAQSAADRLEITWADGHACEYPVRMLRLECRCASCIEEGTGRPILDATGVPDDVRPERIAPVGRYALQFFWSDGHDTGIYTFEVLRALCPEGPRAR